MTGRVKYDEFSVRLPEGWEDLSEELTDAPFTFGNPATGVGALQISFAIPGDPRVVHLDSRQLEEMLCELVASDPEAKAIGPIETSQINGLQAASQRVRTRDDYSRLWMVSDGKRVLLATYTAEWGDRGFENEEVELILASLRFGN